MTARNSFSVVITLWLIIFLGVVSAFYPVIQGRLVHAIELGIHHISHGRVGHHYHGAQPVMQDVIHVDPRLSQHRSLRSPQLQAMG